jgi:hypothetical protein
MMTSSAFAAFQFWWSASPRPAEDNLNSLTALACLWYWFVCIMLHLLKFANGLGGNNFDD